MYIGIKNGKGEKVVNKKAGRYSTYGTAGYDSKAA